ncbi:MAG: hypothetical protein OEY38_20745 [Gammaproteobacteria bacterium]|nr:hypothetical protein [Gammaproteobacteria bacterium]
MLLSFPTLADWQAQIEQLIQNKKQPEGVVFEIVSRQQSLLQDLLPPLQKQIKRLKKQYPSLDIAVVTHGREQFALMSNKANQYQQSHQAVKSLLADDVNVHVCGTFAEMKNIAAEAFPDYVDVAAEGPALIKDYISLGYIKIRVK